MLDHYLYNRADLARNKTIYRLNQLIQDYAQHYFALPINDKQVAIPYFINTKRRKDLRALVGKGTPEEIILETKVWAQVKALDLQTASVQSIRELMQQVGIGIDCSGFVIQILKHFIENQPEKKLRFNLTGEIKYKYNSPRTILARWLRPVENLGANDLTSAANTTILPLAAVRPGDLIRGIGKQRKAFHVAIVAQVTTQLTAKGELPIEIIYWHSHREYGSRNGVKKGKVLITKPQGSWLDQDWQESDSRGHNWLLDDLTQEPKDCGFRRLNCLKNFYPH